MFLYRLMFFMMPELPKENEPVNPERRKFLEFLKNAAVAVPGAILFGCATAGQNTESQPTGKRKPFDWKRRPEWVDSTEKVQERSKYVFAIGSQDFGKDGSDAHIYQRFAELQARSKLVCHLNGTKTVVEEGKTIQTCEGSLIGSRTVDSYLEETDDGFVIHVLMAVRK